MKLQQDVSHETKHTSQQWRHILSAIGSIEEIAEFKWENETDWEDWAEDPKEKENSSDGKTNALNLVKGFHEDMTNFLRLNRIRFRDLVAAHVIILCSPRRFSDRMGHDSAFNPIIIENVTGINPYELGRVDLLQMRTYFDELPELVTWARERYLPAYRLTDQEIKDAWLSMMFRAFYWHRSHVRPLPSEYWNSKMPVYIG